MFVATWAPIQTWPHLAGDGSGHCPQCAIQAQPTVCHIVDGYTQPASAPCSSRVAAGHTHGHSLQSRRAASLTQHSWACTLNWGHCVGNREADVTPLTHTLCCDCPCGPAMSQSHTKQVSWDQSSTPLLTWPGAPLIRVCHSWPVGLEGMEMAEPSLTAHLTTLFQ